MEELFITDVCKIYSQKVVLNNEILVEDLQSIDVTSFLKNAFKLMEYQYPKFFKMDVLSKLTILASEPILEKQTTKNIALVFMNKSGSLDTDLKHQESIKNQQAYYPSPANFVYTLANICLGEVSIKHKLETENIFFMSETVDANLLYNYANYLILHKNLDKVLCGWTEVLDQEYQATLYLVEKKGYVKHTVNEIEKIFL